MRAFFVVGLGCICSVAVAADGKSTIQMASVPQRTVAEGETSPATPQNDCADSTALTPSSPSETLSAQQTREEVRDVLGCITTDIKTSGFKCELMAINPTQSEDVYGKKSWQPLGQAQITAASWNIVSNAVRAALKDPQPHRPLWYSPAVGLRANIPTSCGSRPAGQYVILMFFDTRSLQLYYKSKDNGITAFGECQVSDNRPWRDILTNAGISLAPKSASSN
jgi:hypothetical protein